LSTASRVLVNVFQGKVAIIRFLGDDYSDFAGGTVGMESDCVKLYFCRHNGSNSLDKRMGCIYDDIPGAMTEITKSALFLLISIGGAA
jgi:hypothetical protein